MPVRPQLMVLYTNDAVEVRYSDGSRLHILPCGTSFTHSQLRDDAHPAIGMEMVTQRCAYVTSTYRDMLLSALDFRNRFAERPFLCEDLCEADQVVHLYTRIKEIAWPKVCSQEHCEMQEDGSVCITSVDEFGSLILSPHRQDFTICYLSPLSHDKSREKIKCRQRDKGIAKDAHSSKETSCKSVEKKLNTEKSKKVFSNNSDNQSDNNYSEKKWNEGLCSPSRKTRSNEKEDLNISPITQASFVESPRAMSNASGSPITPQDAVKDRAAMFRPFSTPTEGLDEDSPNCTPYGETAVFRDYPNSKGHNSVRFAQGGENDGSFLGTVFKPISEGNINDKAAGEAFYENDTKRSDVDKYKSSRNELSSKQNNSGHGLRDHTLTSQGSNENSSVSSASGGDGESKTRCKYTWLTRHISCDECPIGFNFIVKMASEIAKKGIGPAVHGKESDSKLKRKQTDTSKLRQINRKSCQMSELPQPLPLSCPGQHLHKTQSKKSFDDGKNPVEDPTTFSQGRLKVLLIDGIVYRIVRLPTIRVVEVYPGDGSVLISQGMSAHFFLHVIPHGAQVEERTYSIKSPPPATKGSYSVKNLINRAHRFLGYIRQEETTLPASVGLCCWKHEELTLSEPLSTTVLEECTIQGYGKFTALSNGQIRVAFTDRTCLDMMCDFSQRIYKSHDQSLSFGTAQGDSPGNVRKHKSLPCYVHISTTIPLSVLRIPHGVLNDKKGDTCRLLLPNGQYQMINVEHPGVYRRYIDIAKEWAEWVNSSPAQRQKFYLDKADRNENMSVERELQKIQCFNYIVDNTLLKKSSDSRNQQDGFTNPDPVARPSILRTSDHNRNRNHPNNVEHVQRTVQIHSPPSMNTRSSGSLHQSSIASQSAKMSVIGSSYVSSSIPNERPNPIGQSSVASGYSMCSSSKSVPSTFEGFNSVREALMRTSNVIKDIDKILERR